MSKPIIVTETSQGMVVIDYDETDEDVICIVDEAIIRNEDDIYPDDVTMIKNILKKLKLSSQISISGNEFYIVDSIGGVKRQPTCAEKLRIWVMIVTSIQADKSSSISRRYIL
jgi:hypothetical protein